MRQKRGKRRCKSLIIKVFQRSDGVNFTNGTWNKVLRCCKFLFLLIILLYIYIYIWYVPAFQRFWVDGLTFDYGVSDSGFFNDTCKEGEANGIFFVYPTLF